MQLRLVLPLSCLMAATLTLVAVPPVFGATGTWFDGLEAGVCLDTRADG